MKIYLEFSYFIYFIYYNKLFIQLIFIFNFYIFENITLLNFMIYD